jgi:hypothetical protein
MEKSPEFKPVDQSEGAFDLSAFEAQQKQAVSEDLKVTEWTSPALFSPLESAKKISQLAIGNLNKRRESLAAAEATLRHLATMTAMKRKAYMDNPSPENKKLYYDSAYRLTDMVKNTRPSLNEAEAKAFAKNMVEMADEDAPK